MRRWSKPTSVIKPRPPVTSVEATTAMTSPHRSDATIGGIRTESTVGRRWWLRLTTLPDLNLMGEAHT